MILDHPLHLHYGEWGIFRRRCLGEALNDPFWQRACIHDETLRNHAKPDGAKLNVGGEKSCE